MNWYLVDVYAHVLAAIFLVGYALFWAIVALATPAGDPGDTSAFLTRVARSPWPPKGIPSPVRLSLCNLGWAALVVLGATGASLLVYRGWSLERLGFKLFFIGIFLAGQLGMSVRPTFSSALSLLFASLGIVATSVLLRF